MLVTLERCWSSRLMKYRNFVNDDDILTINWEKFKKWKWKMIWARHKRLCENYEEYSFNLCYVFTNDYLLLEHCILFAFEQYYSSHTNDYKRTIKFAFEYSSQRRVRNSRSNFMSFNIVYARNVNVRVTRNRFRKRSSLNNWFSKIQIHHVNIEKIVSDNI
jgi:hypothetical protein